MSTSLPHGFDRRRLLWVFVRLMILVVVSHLMLQFLLDGVLAGLPLTLQVVVETLLLAAVTGTAVWLLVVVPFGDIVLRESRAREARDAQLRGEQDRQAFDSRVRTGLIMTSTESQAVDVIRRSFDRELPDLSATLLMADSSRSHLAPRLEVSADGQPRRCTVERPFDCPAIRDSQTVTFVDNRAVESCPYLVGGDPCSAVCVPMSATGHAVAVLHVPGAVDATPATATVERLESLMSQAGVHIGMTRVLEQTGLQAATDALTGVANRRTGEDAVGALLGRCERVVVAIADLDHFKRLNDAHGHATGDRALRVFADTMRASLRKDDVFARYGGEEFLIAIPDMSVGDARATLHRCQEQLAVAVRRAEVPAFTVSIGIADTTHSRELHELIRLADDALFAAKDAGRDTVVTAGEYPDDLLADGVVEAAATGSSGAAARNG